MTWAQVHRLTATTLTAAILALAPALATHVAAGREQAEPWWTAVGVALTAAATVWLAVCAVRGADPAPAARVLVLTCAVALLTYPLVLVEPDGDGPPGWVAALLPTAAGACAVAFRWWLALAVATSLGALRVVGHVSGTWQADLQVLLNDVALTVVIAAAAVVAVEAVRSQARTFTLAHDAALSAFAHAGAQRAEERERARWDALVHDELLAALTLAGHADDAAGRSAAEGAARTALASLERDPVASDVSGRELAQRLVETVLDVHAASTLTTHVVDDPVTVPSEVAEAVIDAAAEAVRNAARHAAGDDVEPATVAVAVRVEPDRVDVSVQDDGRGFDPRRTRIDRLGLLVSVRGRMSAAGGRSDVRSRAGTGTTVTLSWPDASAGGAAGRAP